MGTGLTTINGLIHKLNLSLIVKTLQSGQPSEDTGEEPQKRQEDLHQILSEKKSDRDGSLSVSASPRIGV